MFYLGSTIKDTGCKISEVTVLCGPLFIVYHNNFNITQTIQKNCCSSPQLYLQLRTSGCLEVLM